MSYYDGDPQGATAANDALEAADASADESPESGLGDGAASGKYCFLEGRYTKACQNCTGFACNLTRW